MIMRQSKIGLYTLLLGVLLIGASLVAGCGQTGAKPGPSEPGPAAPLPNKPEFSYVEKVSADPKGAEGWTELAAYEGDLDGDGQDEQLLLYTSAERDSKGNIMWDDGQKWLLSVEDGSGFYPLFHEYVQLGSVYFNVAGFENSPIPKVTVLLSTGAGMTLNHYSYEPEQKGFRIEPVYDSKAVNRLFTSLPEYR